MPVTLRQLRYFHAVVEHGSFTRAAESVHVSQPALSLQIRELEDGLGAPLFERESRGVLLTPLGRAAYQQTLRILDETLVLETMGKRFDAGPYRVEFGIVSTLAPYLLTGLLERLQASPEPSRRIGLAHRAASHGQPWIDLLAEAASSAGRALVQEAQEAIGELSA